MDGVVLVSRRPGISKKTDMARQRATHSVNGHQYVPTTFFISQCLGGCFAGEGLHQVVTSNEQTVQTNATQSKSSKGKKVSSWPSNKQLIFWALLCHEPCCPREIERQRPEKQQGTNNSASLSAKALICGLVEERTTGPSGLGFTT